MCIDGSSSYLDNGGFEGAGSLSELCYYARLKINLTDPEGNSTL